MEEIQLEKPIRGFVFACTEKTEGECFERMLFGTERAYGPVVIRIRKGDLLFLHNFDTNLLHGVFEAVSDGGFNVVPEAWKGRYPYQVRIEILGNKVKIEDADKTLQKFNLKRTTPLFGKKLVEFLQLFIPKPTLLVTKAELGGSESTRLIIERFEKIKRNVSKIDIEEEIPQIEATTLWDFPRQSYGLTPKGDNKYAGVTPALILFNLIWRYTDLGHLVVDPMCGSGTTIDVCREERRRAIGYDISPWRKDIIQNDAAKGIPLDDNSVDMVFIDSPYGDNIRYNEHPDNIGKISSESELFYDKLETVMKHAKRILKEGKVLAWLIGDQWVKDEFTPVGLKTYERLCRHFEPVDIVCVTRKGQSSNTGLWYNRARRHNFFLRGFKYLIIVRKPFKEQVSRHENRKIEWRYYDRG